MEQANRFITLQFVTLRNSKVGVEVFFDASAIIERILEVIMKLHKI
jgi:hypothetical protein